VPETDQTDAQVETIAAAEEVLVEESLVEEVSIDGMCGVY
jgi:mycofactocin precursor